MVIESYERNSRNAKESNLTRVRQAVAVDGNDRREKLLFLLILIFFILLFPLELFSFLSWSSLFSSSLSSFSLNFASSTLPSSSLTDHLLKELPFVFLN
jgi:hypothetical protein